VTATLARYRPTINTPRGTFQRWNYGQWARTTSRRAAALREVAV
jgi:hypothetical protein